MADEDDLQRYRRAASGSPSTFLQIAVLAALAATGTLATNILLRRCRRWRRRFRYRVPRSPPPSRCSRGIRARQLVVGPISDRYGRRWPVLIGFAVFLLGSIWCGLATDLPSLLIGRVIQAAGACSTSVLSRAIARDLFSGRAWPRDGADHDRDGAPPASRRCSAARSIIFSAGARNSLSSDLAAVAPSPMIRYSAETHRSTRIPLNPLAIAKNYLGLIADRRFLFRRQTVSLIMGGLFAMLRAATARG